MSKRIHLEPNQPITLRLVDPFADSSERYDSELQQCEYRTTDRKILALPRQAAIELNNLNPQPGEEIGVCRHTGKSTRIAVWLTASSEKQRAADEQEPPDAPEDSTDTELLLEASLKREGARKRRNGKPVPIRKDPATAPDPVQPRLFDRGTGTDGPMPARMPVVRPAAAVKTPYGVMLRHIIHTVESSLKAEGIQLGDGPKQDLISTVYIDAARRSGIEYDFTRGAE
jgi:hypothetical protein